MSWTHLFVININWYQFILAITFSIFLLSNIMLIIMSLKKNKDDATKVKVQIIIRYVTITCAIGGVLFLLNFAGSKITIFRNFINFINSIINSSLNKLPLGWIFLWIVVPLLVCYITFTLKGIVYYEKRKSIYSEHAADSKKENAFNFSDIITFENINTTKDVRKFMRSAKESVQYGNFCGSNWIAIYSDDQKINKHIQIPKKIDYPSLLIERNDKWEVISLNEALKMIRSNKQ